MCVWCCALKYSKTMHTRAYIISMERRRLRNRISKRELYTVYFLSTALGCLCASQGVFTFFKCKLLNKFSLTHSQLRAHTHTHTMRKEAGTHPTEAARTLHIIPTPLHQYIYGARRIHTRQLIRATSLIRSSSTLLFKIGMLLNTAVEWVFCINKQCFDIFIRW